MSKTIHPKVEPVLHSLRCYAKVWPEGLIPYSGFDKDWELTTQERLVTFLKDHTDALERTCVPGHITGSALVVNPNFDRVLLTLHAKLGKWLQLGGHADGDSDVAAAALREAREESGRSEVEFLPWEQGGTWGITSPTAFDCDIHQIPARGDQPSHLHYDIRYLCVLDDALPLRITHESKDLRWVKLEDAFTLTQEASMIRQFEKFVALRQQLTASQLDAKKF